MVFDSTNSETYPLYIVNEVVSLFSLLGSFLMAFFIIRNKEKTIILYFILAIAVSDFFYSISNLLSILETKTSSHLCHLEAFTRQFFFALSIMMTSSISILCYRLIIQNKSAKQYSFFWVVMLISIIFSACLALA